MKCFVITFSKKTYLRLNQRTPPEDWTPDKPLYGYRSLIWTTEMIDAEKFISEDAARKFGERYLLPDSYGITDVNPIDYTQGVAT